MTQAAGSSSALHRTRPQQRQRASGKASPPAWSRSLPRFFLLIAAAILAGLLVTEMVAVIGDPMIAAILALILALPFVYALARDPAKVRRQL